MRPLLDLGAQRIKDGKGPLFSSHMWDGSAVSMPENMSIADELITKSAAARTLLEIEIGVVGTTSGVLTLDGATSGQTIITAPAVAGVPGGFAPQPTHSHAHHASHPNRQSG
jgi:fructose/tagatose bisphosphate aldolase